LRQRQQLDAVRGQRFDQRLGLFKIGRSPAEHQIEFTGGRAVSQSLNTGDIRSPSVKIATTFQPMAFAYVISAVR
jgi:hypothetical protein